MNLARLETRTTRRSRRLLRRFLRERAGTTAIEFAMIVVPFLGLIGAVLETGMVYFKTAQLQMATETAKRVLLTNNAGGAQTNQQFINNNVCTWKSSGEVKAGTLSTSFDCNKLMIEVTRSTGIWSGYDTKGADIYGNDGTPYNAGNNITIPGPGDVAIVRLVYPMPVLAGILSGSALGGNYKRASTGAVSYDSKLTYMLVGMAAFRVEPN